MYTSENTSFAQAIRLVSTFKPNGYRIIANLFKPLGYIAMPTSTTQSERLATLDKFRRRLPHVSQSALSAILREFKKGTVPELGCHRTRFYEAQVATLRRRTEYGTLAATMDLVATNGDAVSTIVVNLQAFLQTAFSEAEAFRNFLLMRHNAIPSSHASPWSLVLYRDEYNPGLELTSAHRRKPCMT